MGSQDWLDPDESETMECIFGLCHMDSGHIYILKIKKLDIKCKNCNKCRNRTCSGRQKAVRNLSDPGNTFLMQKRLKILDKFLKKGRYNRKKKEIELARKYVDEVMQTKYSSIELEIGKLSGGNQQKVIISRWLLVTEKILRTSRQEALM